MTVSRGTAIKSRSKICNFTTIRITEDKKQCPVNDRAIFIAL